MWGLGFRVQLRYSSGLYADYSNSILRCIQTILMLFKVIV